MLDPLVDRLQKRGVGRTAATGAIFLLLLLLIAFLSSVIVPALIAQASQLAQNGPQYVQTVKDNVGNFLRAHHQSGPVTLPATADALFSQISDRASQFVQKSSGGITAFLIGSVSTLLQRWSC